MDGNGLQFWPDFLLAWGDTFLGHLSVVIFIYAFVEEDSMGKRLGRPLLLLLLSPLVSAVFMWFSFGKMPSLARLFWGSALNIGMLTLWYLWAFRDSFWRSLPTIGMAGLLQISTSALVNGFLTFLSLNLQLERYERAGVGLLFFIPMLLFNLGLCRALRKLRLGEKFRLLLRNESRVKHITFLLFFLDAILVLLVHMQGGVEEAYMLSYILLTATVGVLAVASIFYVAQWNLDQSQLQAQQDVIAQQQLYEQSLEELRQEMRTFRHDYKNLLTSLGDQAESQELCRSFKKLELEFDKRLGEKIQASIQIGNLRIPQVRSLLLGKLKEMLEQGVVCRLEVLYPIITVGMDEWDFVRCLGILLDNALEAARETEKPWVEILLLQEGDSLMVRVSNPWKKGADMGRIWEEGYSTKGPGRGLGLVSYGRILRAYSNTSYATSWGEEEFVQELAIAWTQGGG